MTGRHLRFADTAYVAALGALGLLALAFYAARNGAALVMCGLIFAGLVPARFANFSPRTLFPVALGLVAILWIVWIDPPAGSLRTGALAHLAGGALAGWALSQYLRPRLAWPLWVAAALAAVFGVTVLWELGELVADRVIDTALNPNRRGAALDVFFGSVGGGAAVLLASMLPAPKQR
jgi:hypothetical protein